MRKSEKERLARRKEYLAQQASREKNIYVAARERWEKEQKARFGCHYIGGVCVTHGGREAKEPEPSAMVEWPLLCNCRSFNHPHPLGAHDELDGDYEWRTPEERARSQQP